MRRTILTVQEVSAMTGVPVETLRYWRKLGVGGPRSWKLTPRRVAYDEDDVNEWLDAQRAASPEPRGAA